MAIVSATSIIWDRAFDARKRSPRERAAGRHAAQVGGVPVTLSAP